MIFHLYLTSYLASRNQQQQHFQNDILNIYHYNYFSFHVSRNQQQQYSESSSITEQRSCSANQLDVIVDILGVPSELLSQRDSNKRLFLLKDKKETVLRKSRPPRRSGTCKVQTAAGGRRERAPPLQSGNKSKSCEDQDSQDLLMEVKRRSIYAKDCRLVENKVILKLEKFCCLLLPF